MQSIIRNPVDDSVNRIISGNVLTGRKSAIDGFLGYYDDMVTIIPEVTEKRFFGWVQPGFNAPSFWRTFVSTWLPRKPRSINTDKNGEDRAFVATGEYEKVMPMDILPMHLAKAVLIEDIELMEQLGIFEVAPEDFALCSYICPSKIEFGEIFEHGMLLMEKEG
jgi:Na+-transporting NADH:ubiquinone oxidoreductase subunit A